MEAETILHEVECLASELFCTTYNLSWRDAVTQAICLFKEMQRYAEGWDAEQRVARQITLMRETQCTAETAIDAVRLSDGRPEWNAVMQMPEGDWLDTDGMRVTVC